MTPATGLLNLHKPAGVTSRGVVDQVQRLSRPAKAGHAGTLDPLASGVLVVCVGAATRLIEYVQQGSKRYEASFLLGRTSATDDVEGEVIELPHAPVPDRRAVEAATRMFVGEIQQRPPAFSALKVRGRRAYELARSGTEFDLAPRPVKIHSILVLEYDYPLLRLDVRCGSGTYVRSLGRDIGDALATGAVMSSLVRTAVGSFTLDQACDPAALTADGWHTHLLPARRAVEHLPAITVSADEIESLATGRPLHREPGRLAASPAYAALDAAGNLIAVLHTSPRGLIPARNLVGR